MKRVELLTTCRLLTAASLRALAIVRGLGQRNVADLCGIPDANIPHVGCGPAPVATSRTVRVVLPFIGLGVHRFTLLSGLRGAVKLSIARPRRYVACGCSCFPALT